MQKDTFGKRGEIIAINYLKNQGYKIIATNYKNKIGEIDIIAKDKDYIVFIEVKARYSGKFGNPLDAINERKQLKVRQVATLYLMKNQLMNANIRFDVIAVLGEEDCEIQHIKDAF